MNNKEYKLSFVIPAYNVEKYVERCLDAIYSQQINENNFEVIVIDDGSIDGTLSVVKKIQKCHANMQVISQKNCGPSIARNNGVALSKGRYIWFVDADDYIAEDSLKIAFQIIEDNSPEVLFFSIKVIKIDGSSFTQIIPDVLTENLMNGIQAMRKGFNIGSACMGIWNRDYLDKLQLRFLPGVNNGEDALFVFSATLQAKRIMVINKPLYVYKKRSESLTTAIVSPDIYLKMKMGDVKIAQYLRGLSLHYSDIVPEIASIADSQYRKILFGLVYSLYKNKSRYKKSGVNEQVLQQMKEVGLYPVECSFGTWKKNLFCFFLNHFFCF